MRDSEQFKSIIVFCIGLSRIILSKVSLDGGQQHEIKIVLDIWKITWTEEIKKFHLIIEWSLIIFIVIERKLVLLEMVKWPL